MPETKCRNDRDTLYKSAFTRWGVEAQTWQAAEECAELIQAISHYRRGRCGFVHLADEIADVEIMCEQLRLIVGHDLVNQAKQEKLLRLEGLLHGG